MYGTFFYIAFTSLFKSLLLNLERAKNKVWLMTILYLSD